LKNGIQTAICCPCGNEKILALGLCATCYTLKRQGAEYFGGLREQVLERDEYACRVCGDPGPGVHHREPAKSLLHLMIALCTGCHAKVHRTKGVLTEFPPLLLVLWREQHPEGHEQTYIDFNVRKPPAQSVPLNFAAIRAVSHEVRGPRIASLSRCKREDIEASARAVEPAPSNRIHIVLASSDLHLECKLRITRD
jgi:hypothetical protein